MPAIFGVSGSAYYRWLSTAYRSGDKKSNAELTGIIRLIQQRHRTGTGIPA
ncbi:MAG: hypothetical protein LBH18_07480 [Spirochaetaceae bacterium]|nr:hypothetical protein [Spirochaetaceae bacterium]